VPQGGARFRVQVMADHSKADVDLLVSNMQKAMRNADLEFRSYRESEGAHAQQWDAVSSAA
jgi:glycine C-acetyltransferase